MALIKLNGLVIGFTEVTKEEIKKMQNAGFTVEIKNNY